MGTSDPYEALRQVLRLVERMPVIGGLQRDMLNIKRTVYERRAPRFAAVASPSVASAALLETLLGAPEPLADPATPVGSAGWVGVETAGRRVQWITLDSDDAESPDRFRAACDRMIPDVLLVLASPAEAENGAEEAFRRVRQMLDRLERDEPRPAVVPILLARPGGRAEGPEAGRGLEASKARFEAAFRAAGLGDEGVFVLGGADASEELVALSERLNVIVPEPALLETARALVHASDGRRRVAHEVIHSCAALGITVSLTPVPFADAAVLIPLQVVMVTTLAYLSGRAWDTRTALEWIASMGAVGGAGIGMRWGARQLFKLVPGAGTVVAAGVAGAGTAAMGHSALAYFMRE